MTAKFFQVAFSIVAIASFILFSCKKEKNNPPGNDNNTGIVIQTTPATSIKTKTATTGGVISSGTGITERGICYSTGSNPTVSGSQKVSDATGNNNFTINLEHLDVNTIYYIRAYAINSKGVAYGEEVTFRTLYIVELNLYEISYIGQIDAKCTTALIDDNGLVVNSKGVCYSTSPNPTISNDHTDEGFGSYTFESVLNGLLPGTTYYIRAYATTPISTGYSNELTFTTLVNPPHYVGESFGGGRIAYILKNGEAGFDLLNQHGLIVTESEVAFSNWGCSSIALGGTGTSYGSGKFNAEIHKTKCYEFNSAPRQCYDLVQGGFDDWVLPSKVELMRIYQNKNNIGFFENFYYFSSSEEDFSPYVWCIDFSDGTVESQSKDAIYYARAVRYF